MCLIVKNAADIKPARHPMRVLTDEEMKMLTPGVYFLTTRYHKKCPVKIGQIEQSPLSARHIDTLSLKTAKAEYEERVYESSRLSAMRRDIREHETSFNYGYNKQ